MDKPILYSFRRCPYAMRARMALMISNTACHIREVKLARKPAELLAVSPKATVPVLVLGHGAIIAESIEIMRWALARNDPEHWLRGEDRALIAAYDGAFKHHLDRYKYPDRHGADPVPHRAAGLEMLLSLNERLGAHRHLCGAQRGITDVAIFPFVRQFAETDRGWFDAQPIAAVQAWLNHHVTSALFGAIMLRLEPWQAGDAPVVFPAG